MSSIILGVTGHRPDRLGGYNPNNLTRQSVRRALFREIRKIQPAKVITGMALGTDTDVAEICLELDIPFIAAKPFRNQEAKWRDEDKQRHYNLLSQAAETHIVCQGGYAPWKMVERNKWIVNHSNMVLGVFNGDKQSGTYQCLKYALERNKLYGIIVPDRVLPVDIKKQTSIIVYAMFDESAPADIEKAAKAYEELTDDEKNRWSEYAGSIMEQMNNSGIVLLDRNDIADLQAVVQRSQNQLNTEE